MIRPPARLTAQVPQGTHLSVAKFAEDFQRRGYVVVSLTPDRFEGHMPTSLYGDVFDVERWFPSPRVIITQTAEGISIVTRMPMRRLAVTSVATGLLAMSYPGTFATRLMVGGAAALFMFVFQIWNGRRRGPMLLAFGGQSDRTKNTE